MRFTPPPRIAVCGSGIDVLPLVEILKLLQWHVHTIDHSIKRPQQNTQHQPNQVIKVEMNKLADGLSSYEFDAVVIMNHNLDRDAAYLKYFASTPIPWIGLLGPIKRRDKVLNKVGLTSDRISSKLHAPVGLDLGGHMPENIAVSIAAQLQHHFYKT